MMPAVDVTGLSKSYQEVDAVSNVSIRVEPGEAVAVLGPNGSGKTTTLRCVAGLLRPDRGNIRICGLDLHRDYREARRQFSFLPQQATFPASITVLEVLRFHSKLRGVSPERIFTSLREAGIPASDENRRIGELSGGMRQRLSLAVAGLPEVKLMVLDEPTANLDPEAALELRRIALQWRDEGRSLLFATHVLSDVEELANRVVVLVEGRTVAEAYISDLRSDLRQFSVLRVNVGTPKPEHVTAAIAAGATSADLNAHSVLVTAPVDCRYEVLRQMARLGPIHHF